jgi:PAS domain S-box-containing protein
MPIPASNKNNALGTALQTVLAALGFVSLIFWSGAFVLGWLPEIGQWFASIDRTAIAVWAGLTLVIAILVEVIATSFLKSRKESKQAYERLLYMAEATGYASWEVDLSLDSIWWGVGAEKVFGRASLKDENGVEFWEKHVHPEDKDRVNASCNEALSGTGSHWADEYRLVREDGTIVVVLDQGRIIRDGQGKALRMVGGILDITERSQAFEALQTSEKILRETTLQLTQKQARLAAAQAVAKIGSWEVDLGTMNVTWSKETFTVFDMDDDLGVPSIEEFIGNIHPEDRDEVKRRFDASLHAPGCHIEEHRLIARDGGTRYIEERWEVIGDESGTPIQIVGTCQDITVRRKSESEKRRLLAAIEQLDDAVLIADPEGGIVYANGANEQITGYARHDVLGSRGTHLGVPDDAAWSTIRQGFPWRGIQKATRKDGSTYFEECVVSPVHNQRGVLVNLIAVKKDVSDQQQLESHYREAEKMTAVGQLAGGIAHDFNNMLTVVQVQAELAQLDATLPEKLRPAMEMIQQAAVRSADLTRELLTFARRQPNAPKVVDLGANVQTMTPMLRSMVGEEVQFVTTFQAGLWNVKIDVSQFDHLLANLCLNARDAVNGRGKITVAVSNLKLLESDVVSGAPSGEYVQLLVSDSGGGMPPEVLKHAFEPFFTTKSDGKGTGLGLAVVHGIVRQHGGFISLQNREGEGLVAAILWPRCTEGQDSEPVPGQVEVSSGREKILLVDDEPMLLATVKGMLAHLGYQVVATSDPLEALALCESGPESDTFALLLTDIVMPQMNGIDLSERIRLIKPELTCLFMSGYSDKRLSGHLRANWPNRILNKPFRLDELSAALDEVFCHARSNC